jgi:hypothetical protein
LFSPTVTLLSHVAPLTVTPSSKDGPHVWIGFLRENSDSPFHFQNLTCMITRFLCAAWHFRNHHLYQTKSFSTIQWGFP